MFALSFTSLALARFQQSKEIKQERKSQQATADKKPLVPDIARRGIVALAIVVMGACSAQARGFGGFGGNSGGGAGFFHGMSNRNQVQPSQTQPAFRSNLRKNDAPFVKTTNVEHGTSKLNVAPVSRQTAGAGLARHAETTKKLDLPNKAEMPKKFEKPRKFETEKKLETQKRSEKPKEFEHNKLANGGQPRKLGKRLGDAKPLNGQRHLNVNKTASLSKHGAKTFRGGRMARHALPASKRVNSRLVGAVNAGKLNALTGGAAARKIGMADQFKLMGQGDIARRLKLDDKLQKNGGWQKRMCGPLDSHYCQHCKGRYYGGPKWCPTRCWCPTWCDWMQWCSDGPMAFDPRPDFCEPVDGDDCDVDPDVAVDQPGNPDSWVDDDRPQEPDDVAVDLELVAVRFVDNGDAEKNIGPRYRVLIRNDGNQAVDHPFNVAILTGTDEAQAKGTPRAGKRIPGIDAGQTLAVDIRLPIEANATVKDDDGHEVAEFPKLGAMVDTRDEIEEQTKENNGVILDRGDIGMVDPEIFAADITQAAPGEEISLAGEGLGPEAGQVLVRVGGLELQAEIVGWYDLGVRVRLPSLPLAGEAKAEIVVVRGDDAAANPISLKMTATQSAPPPPA